MTNQFAKFKCKMCMWNYQCVSACGCPYHTPFMEDIDNDEYVAELEREKRSEFYDQWNEYVDKFYS